MDDRADGGELDELGAQPGRGSAGDQLREAVTAALTVARAEGRELKAAAEDAVRAWARRYTPVHVSVQFLGIIDADSPADGKLRGRMRIRFTTVPVSADTTINVRDEVE